MSDVVAVSIVLPVYNGAKYLRGAITSILQQTFSNFELIIVNDGSTDDSAVIIAEFHDPRIQIITQVNQGLRGALNAGIARASGTFIARMDQDDISLPERLAKQVAFLETHPDHVLVGTTYAYIDEEGKLFGVYPALLDDENIKRELFTKNPFGHGTVMFRADDYRNGKYSYQQEAVHMEDYDLWFQFARAGKYANLADVLYLWRSSPTNTTNRYASIQQRNAQALLDKALAGQNLAILIRWPGWQTLRKYRNMPVVINGEKMTVRRKDAHCSLYLALAWLFFRKGKIAHAVVVWFYALLVSPGYFIKVLGRRIVNRT